MRNTILVIVILMAANVQLVSQVDRVMTYNLRYDNPNDGVDRWDNRKAELVDFMKYYEPDVFGIQEGLLRQVSYLQDHLSQYAMIGVGRDDGIDKGEFSSIFYNKEKLTLVNQSTFWLSETSDKISVGWDASMERICTYGLFENKDTKDRILVFNAHYDHRGAEARVESSKLILQKIKEINTNDYPIVLMGDFNAQPNEQPIILIAKEMDDASRLTADGIYGPIGTFTGFKQNEIPMKRIDYIFTKGLDVKKYRHIDDKMSNNNYLSDHLPVLIEIE